MKPPASRQQWWTSRPKPNYGKKNWKYLFQFTSPQFLGDFSEHGNLYSLQDGWTRSLPRLSNLQDGESNLQKDNPHLCQNQVMGEKEEEETAGGGEEEKEGGGALEEEEQEEVATEDLVEKGTVALSETTTHWLLSVAGTCVEEGDEKAGKSSAPFAGVDPRSGQSVRVY